MPSQISTVLYISDYKEKTSTDYFIGSAIGHARIDESDNTQAFNITMFYPMDSSKPCYLPKVEEGQVLSISNSKFSMGNNNELNVSYSKIKISYHY
jgi:hypothetical protein